MGCDVNDLSLMQDDEITNEESFGRHSKCSLKIIREINQLIALVGKQFMLFELRFYCGRDGFDIESFCFNIGLLDRIKREFTDNCSRSSAEY